MKKGVRTWWFPDSIAQATPDATAEPARGRYIVS